VKHASERMLFDAPLADLQLTQAAMADSAVDIDAATLLVYRAGWTKDHYRVRVTREASAAKLFATEMAQRVIDRAVQIFGGRGVCRGVKIEALYREIRALRIYEGASEVQKIVIARELLKARHTKIRQAAE
ncbi:MAG: acyl-CoA dehydrogenase, partial [Pseudorhodoplanes sp.]|nr:acyl-CoA dehydrogenase [Pseudorhodoplanes sp.]